MDGGVLWYQRDFDYYGEDDNFGWYVRPHLHAKWGYIEEHAGAQYMDVGGSDNRRVAKGSVVRPIYNYGWEIEEWSAFAQLYYQVAPGWGLTAGVHYSEESTSINAGVRGRF